MLGSTVAAGAAAVIGRQRPDMRGSVLAADVRASST